MALVGKKEEYFPMKPCALIVPVDVTARTTKRVLEVVKAGIILIG